MKHVVFGAVALFVAGCAGSRPAVTFRSAEAPSRPVPARASSAAASTPRAAHGGVARRVSSPAAAPMTPAPAAAAPATDPNVAECAHIFDHIIKSKQLLDARAKGASAAATTRAVLTYLDELALLDETHPKLHHELKLRLAALSSGATQAREMIADPNAPSDDDGRAGNLVVEALEALGEYCGPLAVAESEAS